MLRRGMSGVVKDARPRASILSLVELMDRNPELSSGFRGISLSSAVWALQAKRKLRSALLARTSIDTQATEANPTLAPEHCHSKDHAEYATARGEKARK